METVNQTLTYLGNPLLALYGRLAAALPNLLGALLLVVDGLRGLC